MLKNGVKGLFFSPMLVGASHTKRIAYVAVLTAICVVCNMYFEFKLADTQFSLTLFVSALSGVLLGSAFGFVACFIGDLLGFLCNTGGFAYMPWIGIAMGVVSFIFGLVVNGFDLKFKGEVYVKIALSSVLTFLICTVGINTTAFWICYNTKAVPYFDYLLIRLFVSGQIWNSVFNYALCFAFIPLIMKNNFFSGMRMEHDTKDETDNQSEQVEQSSVASVKYPKCGTTSEAEKNAVATCPNCKNKIDE